MGNYRNDKRGGSRDRNASMHKAKCSECGKSCDVPFKPTSGKPVYCSDCFSAQRGDRDRDRSHDKKPRHFDRGDKQMHQATCSECGNKCEVPFKPTGSKPIYCSDCFSNVEHGGGSSGSSKQFDEINEKLDRILRALGTPAKKEEKDEVKELYLEEPKEEDEPKKTKTETKKAKKVAKKAAPKKAKAKAKKKK